MQKGLCSAPQLSLYPWLRPAQPLACYSAWHCPPRQLIISGTVRKAEAFHPLTQQVASVGAVQASVLDERKVEGMSKFLDSLKWDENKLVTVIVQVSASTLCGHCRLFSYSLADPGCTACSMSTLEQFSCKPLLTELPSARRFRQGAFLQCNDAAEPWDPWKPGGNQTRCITSLGGAVQAGNLLQPIQEGALVQGRDVRPLHQSHRSVPGL